jgi:hypothetical protein
MAEVSRDLPEDAGLEAVEKDDQHHGQSHPADAESQPKFLLKQVAQSQVSPSLQVLILTAPDSPLTQGPAV